MARSLEAWVTVDDEVFYGPFVSWWSAWTFLTSLPGDGYVLGPTDAEFCRAWIGERTRKEAK